MFKYTKQVVSIYFLMTCIFSFTCRNLSPDILRDALLNGVSYVLPNKDQHGRYVMIQRDGRCKNNSPKYILVKMLFSDKRKQECIPVGCVPSRCSNRLLGGGCPPRGRVCVSAKWGVCLGGVYEGGVSAQGGVCKGSVSAGGYLPRVGCLPRRGVCLGGICPGGRCLPGGVWQTPPCEQNDRCL